jgi:hypothetical protein
MKLLLLVVALAQTSWPQLGVPHAVADAYVAKTPCNYTESVGETLVTAEGIIYKVTARERVQPGTNDNLLQCVMNMAAVNELTGTWYLKDTINGGWWKNTAPGVWAFAGKEHP